MTTPDEIARGLEHCYARVEADQPLMDEFGASRSEFFVAAGVPAPGSELRHLEWFLLERPSARLGAVPAVALLEGPPPGVAAALKASLLGSVAGAFEVTSTGGGEVHWVRDLFTRGEHPLMHTSSLEGIQAGDLLVGRLFPGKEGLFVPSPAVSTYRSPALLAAVRADLGAMRGARRGVLRVQQLDLERLFHGHAVSPSSPRPRELRERARAGLIALGLQEEQAGELLVGVRKAALAGAGANLTELLNRLAFETPVDLEKARRILLEVWQEEGRASHRPAQAEDDARVALEAFDRGRAAGKDLELLFRDLERDLGLDEEPGSGEDAQESTEVPDFPGVVGAMVEEFLWEVEREQGASRARVHEGLRVLGDYARDIGVFEDLGRARLLDFTARWILDETHLSKEQASSLLDALSAFCRWAEEAHQVPLQRDFGSTLQRVRQSILRLVEARPFRTPLAGGELGLVTCVEQDRVGLQVGSEDRVHWASIPRLLGRLLQVGDLVRLGQGGGPLGGFYPGELRELLAKV